jgi:predicted O-methyltransferase YrrM
LLHVPEAIWRLAFNFFQRAGIHVTANNFYSPIPDTRELPVTGSASSDPPGINFRGTHQVQLVRTVASEYGAEFNSLRRHPGPDGSFYLENSYFESVDAELLFGVIRHFKPNRVIEMGSGFSSLLIAQALGANEGEGRAGRLTTYDPYPRPFMARAAQQGLIDLHAKGAQQIPRSAFEQLRAEDVLFIDSSHVLRVGSDVQYLYLQVLPRLAPGVLVHVHDIFLPDDYPPAWPRHHLRFWNEQYLLQAFLAFNSAYEVLLGSAYLHRRHANLLQQLVPSYDPKRHSPGSFWMRRAAEGCKSV